MKYIVLKDANVNLVPFYAPDLYQQLVENSVTLFGMDLTALAEFRCEYLKRGGTEPITCQKIREVFSK